MLEQNSSFLLAAGCCLFTSRASFIGENNFLVHQFLNPFCSRGSKRNRKRGKERHAKFLLFLKMPKGQRQSRRGGEKGEGNGLRKEKKKKKVPPPPPLPLRRDSTVDSKGLLPELRTRVRVSWRGGVKGGRTNEKPFLLARSKARDTWDRRAYNVALLVPVDSFSIGSFRNRR